jgi:CBS domain-containing protein
MKVSDVMTSEVQYCTPETNLAVAALQMFAGDCGTLPVVEKDGKVIGMITDRDICMAVATRRQDIADIKVGEVPTGHVQSCAPEIEVRDALKIFEKARVRRLPVVGEDGNLRGILSMSDIVLKAGEESGKKGVSNAELVDALKTICTPYGRAFAAGAGG